MKMIMLFPLILAAFFQTQDVFGAIYNNGHQPVILPQLPARSNVCKYDAFMASTPYNGKVYLFPWETRDQRGTWLKNYGFCAQHCAEMVTIHSQQENEYFLSFMRTSVFDGTGLDGYNVAIWLGAQVNNQTFSGWTNGQGNDYDNKYTYEYDQDGLTCLNAALDVTPNTWYNYYCDWQDYFVACQRPSDWTPNQAPPCYNTNDLIILLDSSGSIGSANYETAKQFVDQLTRVYTAQTTSRVGFILFSDTVVTIFPITNTLDQATMTSTILGAPYLSSITNTDLGINAVIAEFIASPPSNPSTPRNMVIITDGQSTNPPATIIAAGNLVTNNIRTFAVGVGAAIDPTELLLFANGDASKVYNAVNFNDLVNYLNTLSSAICATPT